MTTRGPNYSDVTKFDAMIGKTITSIEGKVGDEVMTFVAKDWTRFVFWYEQDCCASCSVEDVCGDLADLIGSPLVEAEEVTGYSPPAGEAPWEKEKDGYQPESFTWTFYRFATAKGSVTVRWLGESNGYYSESVSYREEPFNPSCGHEDCRDGGPDMVAACERSRGAA